MVLTGWLTGALCLTPRAGLAAEEAVPGQRHFEGTLTEVDPVNGTITGKGFWFWSTPTFNVGEQCLILVSDKPEAGFKDLRAGQHVRVRYRVLDGVKVANQISEENPAYEGHVTKLNAEQGSFRIQDGIRHKNFVAGPDCRVLERGQEPVPFAELKEGHLVRVTYLDVGPTNLAVKIEQTSQAATGTLEAMDADARVIRTQRMAKEHNFTLADSCVIMVGPATEGGLKDLKLGDKLLVHFEAMDGVQVANRVERMDARASDPEQVSQADGGTPTQP